MKKLKVLSFTLLMGLFVGFASCSSSKETYAGLGLEKEKSPAQIYWEANTKIRAYGHGTRLNESVAANIAESDARARMARSIEVAVKNAIEKYYKDHEKSIVNGTEAKSAYDAISTNEEHTQQLASQILKNVNIVKYNAYLQKNGETTVHLCLEYAGGENALVEAITEAVFDDEKIKNQLSDDEKAKMDQSRKEFKKHVYDSLDSIK